MTLLHRARLALLVAIVFACVLVGLDVPFSALVHERSAIATASSALRAEQNKNRSLSADIAALQHNSTVGEIAHEDYGLVNAGQQSFAVLPNSGRSALSGLASGLLKPAQIEPSSSTGPSGARLTTSHSSGFFGQVVSRLEFWRSL